MAAKGEGSARLMTFVTQEEAEEIKKKRQAEWERVRKPGDPEGKWFDKVMCLLLS